jgi:hypothetical protein
VEADFLQPVNEMTSASARRKEANRFMGKSRFV